MKNLLVVIGILAIVVTSGCTTIPPECPDMGYSEYGKTGISISTNIQALNVMKEYMNSTNIAFYGSIKNHVPEDMKYKEIRTVYGIYDDGGLVDSLETEIYAWVLNNKFAIDQNGTVHEHVGCA
ncbi:MAG: hypothetical protein ABIJ92_02930 [Candidatus Aenigmatarchaeota archaeon]